MNQQIRMRFEEKLKQWKASRAIRSSVGSSRVEDEVPDRALARLARLRAALVAQHRMRERLNRQPSQPPTAED